MRVVLACALLVGCSSDDVPPGTNIEPSACAPGEWLREDAVCVPPGLPPDQPCPPGEWLREADDRCIPAGVAPDECGTGFVHDGDRGCAPILPAESCADGRMAVPGDRSCREVAPCGSGTWGNIAVESTTEHVDVSYAGGGSDGSAGAPWTSIQEAVNAASPGAIVAVAAGSYLESVRIQGKPVRIWGRCPELVEVVGSAPATLDIRGGASGTEVRSLAITGEGIGVMLSGAQSVSVENAWIHGNASRGVNVQEDLGPAALALRGSLLERNHLHGVFVYGSEVTVEASVVRDTLPLQGFGRGINVLDHTVTLARAHVVVDGSLLERNQEIAVFVTGSDTVVSASVIRDTLPDVTGAGRAINAQDEALTGERANVTLTTSLLERNQEVSIHVSGSDADVRATVVRETYPDALGPGRGIDAQVTPETGAPSSVAVRSSLFEHNRQIAIHISGSEALLQATAVRDTVPGARGRGGHGINIQDDDISGLRAGVDIQSCLLERNHGVGILVNGSDAAMETTLVRDTTPDGQGMGRAVQVQSDLTTGASAWATLCGCVMERSFEAGIALIGAATAEIEACIVRDIYAREGFLGDGMTVWIEGGPATAKVIASRFERNARSAISSFGASVTMGSSALVCHSFDLAAETWAGQSAVHHDLGGVLCGCPNATEHCIAKSFALEPPPPVGGLE